MLANFGSQAERYCYSDSNSCLMKLGMIGETIVNLIFSYDKIPLPLDGTAADRINTLLREGFLSRDEGNILHALRIARNKAVHENYADVEKGKALMQMAYGLCEWFMMTYGDWSYQQKPFVMPLPEEQAAPAQDRAAEAAKEEALIQAAEGTAAATEKVDPDARRKRAQQAASQRVKSEAETRFMIDGQLRQVGWEADSENLRHSKGARPAKGRNIAIAEWPTASASGKTGHADYALFIGEKLVAIIEAKAAHRDIPSVIDYQCKEYARGIRPEDAPYQIGAWGDYKVPLVFATNGRPYLEQPETKSGIWFLDLRQPHNAPKALRGWISPSGIEGSLARDAEAGNQNLREMPYDLLTDRDGLNLRPYQLDAIRAAEEAIANGRQNVLLAMATGTGKTRTVLGMIYRFLKTGRFRRILFLVDRNALGEQAGDVFREVKLEELMTLNDIYNIKGLDEKSIDRETRVQVATVQGMVKRILYSDGERMPAVTDYDLLIIDEAHRGYILDKEMGDAEVLYRDQADYQSKYRAVIEYFDAVRIALTATPALQTTQIFGQPVYKYTYREAVIEGYLVDHDAPHIIKTELSEQGIHYRAGDSIVLYNPVTGEITNSELLDDELDFDVDNFNRQVVNENFNRVVLAEIARGIDPEAPRTEGKTLIYAVSDAHADMIVRILKEYYSALGVSNDAVMKITASVGGGNRKKVQEAINRFRNEDFPSIAVTVDLLTTGIDVPEITALVFMRRVKSRILYEQMLGRATRLCPDIHKTHFEIYDPVGVYESLAPFTAMKPVVANPATSFTQLFDGLAVIEDEEQLQGQVDQIVAKLQRRKRDMSEETEEQFMSLTDGMTPDDLIEKIEQLPPEQARETLQQYEKAFEYLQVTKDDVARYVVISDAPGRADRPRTRLRRGQPPRGLPGRLRRVHQDQHQRDRGAERGLHAPEGADPRGPEEPAPDAGPGGLHHSAAEHRHIPDDKRGRRRRHHQPDPPLRHRLRADQPRGPHPPRGGSPEEGPRLLQAGIELDRPHGKIPAGGIRAERPRVRRGQPLPGPGRLPQGQHGVPGQAGKRGEGAERIPV